MKRKSVLSALLCLLTATLFLLGGCTGGSVHFRILSGDELSIQSVGRHVGDPLRSLTIAGVTYTLHYSGTVRSLFENRVQDEYQVPLGDGRFRTVRIDPDSGQVVSFYGEVFSSSFPQINRIGERTDGEIRAAVEALFYDWVDFPQYNDFTLYRYETQSPADTAYTLQWRIRRELLCMTGVTVQLTADGRVVGFHRTDDCPEGLDSAFVTAEQRRALLDAGLCREWGIDTLEGSAYRYEVLEEVQCYFRGKDAIRYTLTVYINGFPQIIVAVIY